MDSFFSGTDIKDLEINAPKNNIYLSLIVNNKEQMVAKMCFIANIGSFQTVAKAFDENGHEYDVNLDNDEKQYLIIYDCDIEIKRANLRDDFIKAVDDIMVEPVYSYGSNFTYGNNFNNNYGSSVSTQSSYSKSYNSNNTFSNVPPVGKSFAVKQKPITYKKKESKKDYYITNNIPDFATNVLITFADRTTFKDFLDVIDYYSEYEIAPKVLQDTFFDNFQATYDEYFHNIKSDQGFKSVLEALLEEYEDYLTVKPSKYNKYIEVLVDAVQKMINKI